MKIRTANIKIGQRLRENLGDLDELAESIKVYGLLHPIIVDDKKRLVAGRRRLEACKRIGVKMVDVKLYGQLSDLERREIELEENVRRKDLTAYERSKFTKELAQAAKEVAAKEEETLPKSGRVSKGKRGPSKRPTSQVAAADRTGIPRQTISDAETHVAAAERYPILQAPDWTQCAAVETAKKLDTLPAKDRRKILMLVEESGAPARETQTMIQSFERASSQVRKRVYDIARNGDERNLSLVITYLAKTAPEPDPRLVYLDGVTRDLRRFQKRFKADPLNSKLGLLIDSIEKLQEAIKKQHKKKLMEITR